MYVVSHFSINGVNAARRPVLSLYPSGMLVSKSHISLEQIQLILEDTHMWRPSRYSKASSITSGKDENHKSEIRRREAGDSEDS